jgi:hypothetical protein
MFNVILDQYPDGAEEAIDGVTIKIGWLHSRKNVN